ncbi:MAG TPA: glycosyltransferase [Burkholderiaceae bacterium]|nr:glycosyltransferase [Burkholderiaceae bacterium]
MSVFLIAFIASLTTTLFIVRSAPRHAHLSGDTDQSAPQKFHARVVPRVGGIGIALGLAAALLWAWPASAPIERSNILGLGLSASIAFGAGLIEDFTKRVTPSQRLLAVVLAAAVALWLVGTEIIRIDVAVLDALLAVGGVSIALTLFAVAGVANSINIIDGFNGLASMCVAIMLGAIAYVANLVGDTLVLTCALAGLGAVLGFFVWNYPFGLVFLGDGGAYFLGFWVAQLGILLVQRNEEVSPMFPLLLCAYPMFETLFTMYRRKVVRGRPVGQPDATHLHSLVYRRLMRWAIGRRDSANLLRRNSLTSPYLWLVCSLSAGPALLCWDQTGPLGACLLGFCLLYLALYRAIVRFRTPRLLVRTGEHWAAEDPVSKSAG